MDRGQFMTYSTVQGAFTVDETALWLARLDGLHAVSIEDLTAVNQVDYRNKAVFLHEYLLADQTSQEEDHG